MERTTVTFSNDIYKQLKERAQKNGNQSVSQCIRELVILGLKIEEAASKADKDNKGSDLETMLFELKNLLKSNLNWSLETRLLSRVLIENHSTIEKAKQPQILEKCRETAQTYVKGLLGESEN